jgi:hypothetical protein
MKKKLLLLLLPIVINFTYAQDKSILFYIDEDLNPLLQFANAKDQNYTMGLGFGYASSCLDGSFVMKPLTAIDHLLVPKEFRAYESLMPPSLTLNGTAFTPDDLTVSNVIDNDRPYAFLLCLSSKKSYLKGSSFISTEFNLGVIGLDIGKWVQTSIHKSMNDNDTKDPRTPRGWHNQISDGGELTILYTLNYEHLMADETFFEFKVGTQGMVGYYTGANLQAATRFGWLDNSKWMESHAPLGSADKGKKSPVAKKKFELYLFGSLRPTTILYNEMLNGGFRHSNHTLDWQETNHFILEWNTGLGLSIPICKKSNSLDLFWAINKGRTSEINTSLSRAHEWGGLYMTYTY